MAAAGRGDPIEHIVLLVMENCSYDRMLGGLERRPPSACNLEPGGASFCQDASRVVRVRPDPKHELSNVLFQIDGGNANFVRDYSVAYPETTGAQRRDIMGYYPAGFLTSLHSLARAFTVCDTWFCSVPGPTWPNRLFALSGASKGRVKMPESVFDPNIHWYDQTTLFDRLNEENVDWKVYVGDVPLSLLFTHQWRPGNLLRYRPFKSFARDARGPASRFPSFSLIEPRYLGRRANDDHPDHDVRRGEALIAEVYNALRANEELFDSTLLVLTFDEHGGFYDRQPPPSALPPDGHREEYDFTRLGVRVPALAVAPWVSKGVVHDEFDHTSLLKFAIEKWTLGPLGARTAAANSIGRLLGACQRL
jgi:phospholipase C